MMEKPLFRFGALRLDRRAAVLLFPGVTLILVAANYLGTSMSGPIILALLVGGVVFLGLPHGSLDPLVAMQILGSDRRFTIGRFLLAYSLLAAVCVGCWLAFPNVGLSLFLIISALHFGSDWQQRGSSWGRIAYGACIVSVPTLHHAETVRQIFTELGATAAVSIVNTSKIVSCFAIAVAWFSLLPQLSRRWRDGLELAVILIGALALQPLIFFVCYFCLLHSPRHLFETSREVGLRGVGALITAVAPTVGATLVFAALLWRFLPAEHFTSHVLQIVFIGLAALTVPHMLLTEIKEREQQSTQGF